MVRHATPSAGSDNNLVARVCKVVARELPPEQSRPILEEIARTKAISEELGRRIADLLDGAVTVFAAGQSMDQLRAEYDERAQALKAVGADLAGQRAAVPDAEEARDYNAFVEYGTRQQQGIVTTFRGTLAAADRAVMEQVEADSEAGNRDKMQRLYRQLNGSDNSN